jgi:uncharacterized membrane protein (DUF485 family)
MVNDPTPYSEIAQSPRFRALLDRKKQFLIPLSAFFFVFYFALPVMTSYFPAVVNIRAIGAITWAWLFAFAQFIMIWTLCALYVKKAETFDADAAAVIAEEAGGNRA